MGSIKREQLSQVPSRCCWGAALCLLSTADSLTLHRVAKERNIILVVKKKTTKKTTWLYPLIVSEYSVDLGFCKVKHHFTLSGTISIIVTHWLLYGRLPEMILFLCPPTPNHTSYHVTFSTCNTDFLFLCISQSIKSCGFYIPFSLQSLGESTNESSCVGGYQLVCA